MHKYRYRPLEIFFNLQWCRLVCGSVGLDGDKKDVFDLDAYPEIIAARLMKKQNKKAILILSICSRFETM